VIFGSGDIKTVINDTISCRSRGAVAKFTPSDEAGSYQP